MALNDNAVNRLIQYVACAFIKVAFFIFLPRVLRPDRVYYSGGYRFQWLRQLGEVCVTVQSHGSVTYFAKDNHDAILTGGADKRLPQCILAVTGY